MLNSILTDILTIESFLIALVSALVLGLMLSLIHSIGSYSSKGFIITIAILPAVVAMVIMLVNGNLGAGVAVAGAFSLVRFRSVPGSAKEINSIFMAMAVGLAIGMGYVIVAGIFVVIVGGFGLLISASKIGEASGRQKEKELRITIPEGLDYTGVFDDLFEKFTVKHELTKVKTANMGSLYKLQYRIRLKNVEEEKTFIDELRCRNGNLEILCQKITTVNEEL